MFSVIFPGQGSQIIGMGKEFFEKYNLVKDLFKQADETLDFSVSKLIFPSTPNFAIICLAPTTCDPSKASLTLVCLSEMMSCPNKLMTTHKFVPK